MPREDSLDESERSLTPEVGEEEMPNITPGSPVYGGGEPTTTTTATANNGLHHHLAEQQSMQALVRVTSAQSKKSAHSKVSRAHLPTSAGTQHTRASGWPHRPAPAPAPLTPTDRFRAAVRKVIALHRGTTLLLGAAGMGREGGRNVGAEPGIDPRRAAVDAAYAHIAQRCAIEVVDYSAVRSAVRGMGNEEFVEFMGVGSSGREEGPPPRDAWVKVRWINIGGVSWDVIKALAIRYQLHPLALEDVFHGHSGNRSKADYYPQHLFLRVLCHELLDDDDSGGVNADAASAGVTDAPRTASPEPMGEFATESELQEADEDMLKHGGALPTPKSSLSKRRVFSQPPPILPTTRGDVHAHPVYNTQSTAVSARTHPFSLLASRSATLQAQSSARRVDEAAVKTLKKGSRVNVAVSPMYIFLFRDGTVISIRPTPNLNFTMPISFRLKSRDTVLRKSADPSLLVHALLDLIVDKAIQVVDQYHVNINKFERQILLSPKMHTVKELHILSGDLILHKRTLDPIKTMIYALRRYDVDRCAALIDTSDPANANAKVVGFMSHKAKIYLADVYDHMEYILTSLDMFAGIADNLINYSFNVASYEMNEVMRRLTIATIIFLPLTVLTGYFGMNFDTMWSLRHSDIFFWELALPILVLVVPIALIGDLKKMWHYLQKRRDIRHV